MNKETNNREEESTGEAFTASERRRVFWLVLVLIPLSWTSIKIVLPALPELGNIFHSTAGVKLSVSLYLIFFACSQPVWGGIVQKTSCRQTLFYSLVVTMIGSLIAMSSFNLSLYLLGRTLEGVGMGAASPIGRTLFTDVFGRKELAHRMGVISGCAATMPAVAPIIGGYLMTYIDWRAIFGFFLLLCVAYFYFAFRWLPETRIKPIDEGVVTTRKLIGTYISILRNTHYLGYVLPYAALTGGLLGYYSAMPFWYLSQLGIAEDVFAYFAIPTVGMYLIGLIVAGLLLKKIDLEEILFLGMLLAFCVFMVFLLAWFRQMQMRAFW
jgi:DHA1 family bicyclomycin/chloramphenicol resistance-like MFS transporter